MDVVFPSANIKPSKYCGVNGADNQTIYGMVDTV